jgi:hypothetical protein
MMQIRLEKSFSWHSPLKTDDYYNWKQLFMGNTLPYKILPDLFMFLLLWISPQYFFKEQGCLLSSNPQLEDQVSVLNFMA